MNFLSGYESQMVHANRPNFRRGGPRGMNPMNMGMREMNFFPVPVPLVRTVYDYTLDSTNLEGTKNSTNDPKFDKEIIERAANLTPSVEVRTRIHQYAQKVMAALEKEKNEQTLSEVGVSRIQHVGSFVTDTTTHSSDKSDIVVELSKLPSYETVGELGQKIVENMKIADPKETGEPLQMPYGCLITSHNCRVRVLVTISVQDSSRLEPGLHLDEKPLMLNCFAVRHVQWFHGMSQNMSQEFVKEYQSLVRVLKDVRSRYICLKPMSVWTLQYLAFYCLNYGPNRTKVSLGTAFRRFFEIIAAGILLPKAPIIIDPTSQNHRIGFDLTLPEMDTLCMGAQTLVRTFATGDEGYRTILGTHGTPADLTVINLTWKGIEIGPSLEAYKEGCMDRFSS
uniref:DZF domain-containing protein n=1 Tax=Caenorhabditis tropicalis TaxID=1561998 RepID=A0A1I7UVV5_9PELO